MLVVINKKYFRQYTRKKENFKPRKAIFFRIERFFKKLFHKKCEKNITFLFDKKYFLYTIFLLEIFNILSRNFLIMKNISEKKFKMLMVVFYFIFGMIASFAVILTPDPYKIVTLAVICCLGIIIGIFIR